tara:strand:+ start:52 stop:495 length:444 start_codon:yes stop_codon:yes gene_type:complete
MAAYTQEQLNSGSLGEVLTGGTLYTFTIATPAYISQSVYFNNAYFSIDSALFTNSALSQSAITAGIDQSNLAGTYGTFTGDVSQSLFVSQSYFSGSGPIPGISTISFPIQQNVGSGAGSFQFTPTTTVPVNSYYLKSTGHMTLNITS